MSSRSYIVLFPSSGSPNPYRPMRVVEAVSKRVFRKIYGRGGCLAQGDKIAAPSGIQHDGSDTTADGPFSPVKTKKGRQRIRKLSAGPCDISDPEGPDLLSRFKETQCALWHKHELGGPTNPSGLGFGRVFILNYQGGFSSSVGPRKSKRGYLCQTQSP